MQDANFNVLGIVDSSGVLKERYEYTPYGQRTVIFSAGSNDANGGYSTTLMSRRLVVSSVAQPWGLCDFGHQGLMHDDETGNVYNRARMLSSRLGRFMQRDRLEYVDGLNVYAITKSSPLNFVDPSGNEVSTGPTPRQAGGTQIAVHCEPIERSGMRLPYARHCSIVIACNDGKGNVRQANSLERVGIADGQDPNSAKQEGKRDDWFLDMPLGVPYDPDKHKTPFFDPSAWHPKGAVYKWGNQVRYNVICDQPEKCPCELYDAVYKNFHEAQMGRYRILGPNSNTFMRALLERSHGCRLEPITRTFKIPRSPKGGLAGPPTTVTSTTTKPPGAEGWNNDEDDFWE